MPTCVVDLYLIREDIVTIIGLTILAVPVNNPIRDEQETSEHNQFRPTLVDLLSFGINEPLSFLVIFKSQIYSLHPVPSIFYRAPHSHSKRRTWPIYLSVCLSV